MSSEEGRSSAEGSEVRGWVGITFWRVLNVIRSVTGDFDFVVRGSEFRALK